MQQGCPGPRDASSSVKEPLESMAEDAGEARVRDSSDVELPELPWRARVALRAAALRFHVRAFARAVATSTGFVRDAAFLFSAWFLIAAIMRYEGDGGRTAASGEAAMGGEVLRGTQPLLWGGTSELSSSVTSNRFG